MKGVKNVKFNMRFFLWLFKIIVPKYENDFITKEWRMYEFNPPDCDCN